MSRRKPETGHFGTRGAPFVGIDTETTGVDAARDRVVEVAVVTLDEALEPVQEFVARVNPGFPIPEAATRVHGITDQDVANCPPFKDVAGKVRGLIGNRVIIAHNAPFDIGVLSTEFKLAGAEALPLDAPAIDTLQIEREVNGNTLAACYQRYTGVPHRAAHGASADVLAAIEVLKAQRRLHRNLLPVGLRELTREGLAEHFGRKVTVFLDPNRRFYRDADGQVRFNFGRHRNNRVVDHPQYVKWMMGQEFTTVELAIATSSVR